MTAPHLAHQPPSLNRELSRRTVNLTGLGAGLIALLVTGAPQAAHAQARPVPIARTAESSPIRFTLTGDQTEVGYTPATDAEPPRLTYQDEAGSLTFAGDEIDLSDHPALGLVASVLLRAAPDAYVDYLTLLLPAVNPVADSQEVPIEAVAIVTRHVTSIGGPNLVSGPLQTYDVRNLAGVAEFALA